MNTELRITEINRAINDLKREIIEIEKSQNEFTNDNLAEALLRYASLVRKEAFNIINTELI